MVTLTVNEQKVRASEEMTVLEVAREMGLSIPTLCYHEALSVYGGCRLCQVEVSQGSGFRLVAACTYPVQEGLAVRTHTEKVLKTRRLILELLWSRCPDSVYLRDLAGEMGLERTRFRPKEESCILCGLCIRLCREKIWSNTMDFVHRGPQRKVSPPFDLSSEWCLDCQCCAGICPIQAIHYTEENDLRGTILHWNTRIDQEQKVMEPPKATVIREDCSGCENCSYICPVGAIHLEKFSPEEPFHRVARVDPESCIGCRSCEKICIHGAIQVPEDAGEPSAPCRGEWEMGNGKLEICGKVPKHG